MAGTRHVAPISLYTQRSASSPCRPKPCSAKMPPGNEGGLSCSSTASVSEATAERPIPAMPASMGTSATWRPWRNAPASRITCVPRPTNPGTRGKVPTTAGAWSAQGNGTCPALGAVSSRGRGWRGGTWAAGLRGGACCTRGTEGSPTGLGSIWLISNDTATRRVNWPNSVIIARTSPMVNCSVAPSTPSWPMRTHCCTCLNIGSAYTPIFANASFKWKARSSWSPDWGRGMRAAWANDRSVLNSTVRQMKIASSICPRCNSVSARSKGVGSAANPKIFNIRCHTDPWPTFRASIPHPSNKKIIRREKGRLPDLLLH